MKIGLLVIDMQKLFLEKQMEAINVGRACEYINYVADLLRSKDHFVIHVKDMEGADESNQETYDIIPEINREECDIVVTKEHANGFWQTDLEMVLLENNISLVIVAGFAAEECVLFTYNGAMERGFKAVLLQNGILSKKQDVIDIMIRDRNVISYPFIEFLVGQE